jgi:acyl-CoA thioesterase-2
VDFQVVRSRDGGTLSTRQVTARQDGEVLLEALASFSTPVDSLGHQLPMTDVPQPNPCRDDAVLHSCLLTYLSGTTMLETAIAMRRATPITTFSALIDHALWFHRPVDLSDWVLSDQFSPSGVGGRGLASATMYNRAGQLVCIAPQELYFGRAQAG